MADTELVILRELLAHEPDYVSGSALAAKLGLSRVAIWLHMEKLRTQGFRFEAARSRGYRLVRRPDRLHLTLIRAHLQGRRREFPILLLDEVDSTNDEAARQLAAGRIAPFVVLAHRQTHGRGRLGRSWHSEAPGNLYASFAFRPKISPTRMGAFTLWMGVNVCELIATVAQLAPGIKWPNDILFDGRKAGGMLTEARIDADQIRDLVFGLGLNINGPVHGWPADLARRAVSLSEKTKASLDVNYFTAALIGRVLLAYDHFVDGEHTKTFADLWQRFDVLRGHPIALLQSGRRIAGIAAGVDDEGSLLIRSATGRLQRFHAGDVTLEKSDASA
ncbi:biotin--[acetyl-CoA-carboxylase] ligase [Opitutus terrae]|uniref:Bifunctional ligase/repressor BirA n=1 Tax=Opitutus terrae (strain DSM 11246 / JCM 15787 / PB90-1) TaxID=452637 RepID=B1ZMC4_OPITP|nr:biotin--[acetyl-CoA-carboxylase] ligase [Opitutus terrae]ACB73377.1 biotin--acetyl-CoA-carboxylase ligase [Opitutus terrae PB90-1]